MNFKDYFTTRAVDYSRYRPHYPPELFHYLASLVTRHKRAWDCATGSGQAALGLVQFFDEVIATDASKKQMANATTHDRIAYAVAPAERTEIESRSVDLVVVAQAVHWFDFERFYPEVKRVLESDGVLALWCYSLLRISPAVDDVVDYFYSEVVGPFWPPERKFVDDEYRSIPFPFEELPAPEFKMEAAWDFHHLVGYLGTWSSVQKYREQYGTDAVGIVLEDLAKAWGVPGRERKITWPLHFRIGKL